MHLINYNYIDYATPIFILIQTFTLTLTINPTLDVTFVDLTGACVMAVNPNLTLGPNPNSNHNPNPNPQQDFV